MKNKKLRGSRPVERPRSLLHLTSNLPLSPSLPTNSVLNFRTPEKQMIKAEPQALIAVRPFSVTRVDLMYLYTSGNGNLFITRKVDWFNPLVVF